MVASPSDSSPWTPAGNIYGTTQAGGNSAGNCYQNLGCGVVFEITP
jgi:hypothetical protein